MRYVKSKNIMRIKTDVNQDSNETMGDVEYIKSFETRKRNIVQKWRIKTCNLK